MAIRTVSHSTFPSAIFADPAIPDDVLIERIQKQNDDRAFSMLMTRHRGIVWRVAKQYLGSLRDAEDIFQEVSLQFYRVRMEYKVGEAKFSSWLYRVAANKCLDILRSKTHSSNHMQLDENLCVQESHPLDTIGNHEIANLLKQVLNDLPQQQKLALSMYYLEEQDIETIAGKLMVTQGAARALIKRGKEKVRGNSSLAEII
ncbi:MAG: sigma-70 family RNA polymerase sigma factor [Pseudobdellovibrionaceae bacterium]